MWVFQDGKPVALCPICGEPGIHGAIERCNDALRHTQEILLRTLSPAQQRGLEQLRQRDAYRPRPRPSARAFIVRRLYPGNSTVMTLARCATVEEAIAKIQSLRARKKDARRRLGSDRYYFIDHVTEPAWNRRAVSAQYARYRDARAVARARAVA